MLFQSTQKSTIISSRESHTNTLSNNSKKFVLSSPKTEKGRQESLRVEGSTHLFLLSFHLFFSLPSCSQPVTFYVVTSLLTRELFSFLIISSQGRKYIECARRRVWGPNTVVLKWSWKRASRAACRKMNKKLERVLSLVSTSYHHPWSRQSLV